MARRPDRRGERRGGAQDLRRHCAHEVAFIVLTGLAERFAGPRDRERARRMREQLDVSAL